MNIGKFVSEKFWAKQTFFFKILIFLFPVITLFFNFLSPQFVSDSRMHLLIARNIINGYGHSYLEANPLDISKIISIPINFWPPGYSLLLVPFVLSGIKSVWIITLSDTLAILMFYFCWYKILKVVFPLEYRLLVLLVFTFFTFGFTPLGMPYAYGSNIWSLLWFSFALLQLALVLKYEKVPSWTQLILFYLFVFLCSLFRYAYYPISLVMIIGIVFLHYKKIGFYRVVRSLAIPIFLFGAFFMFQYFNSNSLNYINSYHPSNHESWHLDNLEKTTSFVANSFLFPINYNAVIWPLSAFSFFSNLQKLSISQIFNTLLKLGFTLGVIIFLGMSLRKKAIELMATPKRVFILLAFLIISQFSFLCYLSLKYPPEIFRGVNYFSIWTYVQEVRYYNAINLVLLVSGIWVMLSFKKKYSIILFALIFSYNGWVYFKIKSTLFMNQSQNIVKNNFWILNNIPQEMIPKDAVFYEKQLTQRKSNYHFLAAMYAEKGIPTLKFMNPQKLTASKPVTLVFAIDRIEDDGGDAIFKKMIKSNKANKIGILFNSKIEIWSLKFIPGQTINL